MIVITIFLITSAVGNVRWINIDGESFTYNLRRIGSEGIFAVKIDLSKPVATPIAPWGWKD